MINKHKLLSALVATTGALLIFEAGAVPVTNWDFTIDSGFTTTNYTAGGGVIQESNINAFWNAPSALSWGPAVGNRSGIDVGGATNGTFNGSVTTDGAAVNTVNFTHTNFPIPAGSVLQTGTLSDRIILNPQLPAPPYDPTNADAFSPPTLVFDINFTETPNAGVCADPSSPIPCNDIFVLDIVGAGFNSANKSINQNFFFQDPISFENHGYNARFFIEGIDILPDTACAAAGAANGCIGISTVEGQVNTFNVKLDISTEQFFIPEPATLAMMSLGLLGMGGYRRYKAS